MPAAVAQSPLPGQAGGCSKGLLFFPQEEGSRHPTWGSEVGKAAWVQACEGPEVVTRAGSTPTPTPAPTALGEQGQALGLAPHFLSSRPLPSPRHKHRAAWVQDLNSRLASRPASAGSGGVAERGLSQGATEGWGGSAGHGAGVQVREAPVRVSRCQPGAPPARPLPARQAALCRRNSPAFLGPPGPPSRRLTSVSSSHLAGPGCQPGPQPCPGSRLPTGEEAPRWGGPRLLGICRAPQASLPCLPPLAPG